MQEPNYRAILLRTIDKIGRTGRYYRGMAYALQRKANHQQSLGNFAAAQESQIRSDSLARCANDMQYVYDRAIERLRTEDLAELSAMLEERHVKTPHAA